MLREWGNRNPFYFLPNQTKKVDPLEIVFPRNVRNKTNVSNTFYNKSFEKASIGKQTLQRSFNWLLYLFIFIR